MLLFAAACAPSPGPTTTGLAAVGPTADDYPAVAEELRDRGDERGLAGLRVDRAAGAITVIWSGEVPQDVRDLAASRPHGITVLIEEGAEFSARETRQARQRILDEPGMVDDLAISRMSVSVDGSGLAVSTARQMLTDAQLGRLRGVAAGVAVHVTHADEGIALFDGR